MGFRVWGSRLRVEGFGFRMRGSRLRVEGKTTPGSRVIKKKRVTPGCRGAIQNACVCRFRVKSVRCRV